LHTPSDFEASVKLWQHATTVRYLGGRALTREEVWLRLLRYWGSWAVLGFGLWRVETRNTGEFVGELGFQELKRDSNPSYAGELEVGWVLMPEFHGQGFGRESLAPVLAWGDAHLDVPRMVCIIHPDNRASLKLASAFGFTPKYDLEYKGGPMTLFERVIAQEAPQR
jgi:RimJ/RimL family protein N-acetyltransferase